MTANKVIIDFEKCKGCTLCIEVCPKKSIQISKKFNKKGYTAVVFEEGHGCTACGFCYLMCPEYCIEVYKENAK